MMNFCLLSHALGLLFFLLGNSTCKLDTYGTKIWLTWQSEILVEGEVVVVVKQV